MAAARGSSTWLSGVHPKKSLSEPTAGVSIDQMMDRIRQQEVVYLGEEHHNRFHIDAAMTVLQWAQLERGDGA